MSEMSGAVFISWQKFCSVLLRSHFHGVPPACRREGSGGGGGGGGQGGESVNAIPVMWIRGAGIETS